MAVGLFNNLSSKNGAGQAILQELKKGLGIPID